MTKNIAQSAISDRRTADIPASRQRAITIALPLSVKTGQSHSHWMPFRIAGADSPVTPRGRRPSVRRTSMRSHSLQGGNY